MSKQIRLSDPTYLRLESVREKRETFSMVVDRLIDLHLMVNDYIKAGGQDLLRKAKLEQEKGDPK